MPTVPFLPAEQSLRDRARADRRARLSKIAERLEAVRGAIRAAYDEARRGYAEGDVEYAESVEYRIRRLNRTEARIEAEQNDAMWGWWRLVLTPTCALCGLPLVIAEADECAACVATWERMERQRDEEEHGYRCGDAASDREAR